MKLAILGSKNSILGFKAIGLDVFSHLQDINLADYGILFITEDWAKKSPQKIDELCSQTLPAILTVPSFQGASQEGIRNLKKIVERAVGSDILQMQN